MRALLFMVMLLAPRAAAAEESVCRTDCAGDLACERGVIECLVAAGERRAAIGRAKALVAAHPGDPAVARLLAGLYEDEGNRFWAIRTLLASLEESPDDCETRSWLAWLHIKEGDLDLAEERLTEPGCPRTVQGRARWALVRAGLLGARDAGAAQTAAVHDAGGSEQMYPEALLVWQAQEREHDPGWLPPLELRVESLVGYTTNASAGLPLSEAGPEHGGGLLRLDVLGRLVMPLRRAVRPSVELSLRGQALDNFERGAGVDLREASYGEAGVRAGLYLGSGSSLSGFLGYRGDIFLLNQGDRYDDKPTLYHEGHRLDGELEIGGGLTLFGGGGRRIFRHRARSRWEADGGAGWGAALSRRISLLLALAGRVYEADNEEHSAYGATLLAVGRAAVGAGLGVRAQMSAGLDRYPGSPPGEGGRDVVLRPSLVLWGPPWRGMRAGIGYELGWRDSTSRVSFSYTEHRTFLRLKYALDVNPWWPDVVEPPGHVPLRWGSSGVGASGLDEERIQDLLRRDEGTRRGSSCAN